MPLHRFRPAARHGNFHSASRQALKLPSPTSQITEHFRQQVSDLLLAPNYDSAQYVEDYLKPHMRRFQTTLALLQQVADPAMRLIDVGSYGSMVPAFIELLGISDITISKPEQPGAPATEQTHLTGAQRGDRYPVRVDRFDVEGRFPYPDNSFDLVVFTEVLEHLSTDPMLTLGEINRVTKSAGWLVLTTPNCASTKSLVKLLGGGNPNLYPVYTKQPSHDRHNREYVAGEVDQLLAASGYEVASLRTVDVYHQGGSPILGLARGALRVGAWASLGRVKWRDRGDTIFALARKAAPVRDRYPNFLYV